MTQVIPAALPTTTMTTRQRRRRRGRDEELERRAGDVFGESDSGESDPARLFGTDDDPARSSGESDDETARLQEADFDLHETASFDEMGELGASDSEPRRGSSDDGASVELLTWEADPPPPSSWDDPADSSTSPCCSTTGDEEPLGDVAGAAAREFGSAQVRLGGARPCRV